MSAVCRLCGGPADFRFRAKDYNRGLSQESFDYFGCRSCGTVFLAAVPADLGRYYPPDYYTLPPSLEVLAAGAGAERYKVDLLQRFVAGGRLLEIGPAAGAFAYLAKRAGFAVETIEMDADCCRFLAESVGVGAVCSADPAAVLPGMGPFDAIALWHVIEHVPDPVRVLEAAAGRLAPGGALIVAAPNPASLQLRLFGPRWTHLDAPRHLQLIPVPALERLGAEHGLGPVLVTCTDPGSLGWNAFGWQYSLRNLLRPGSAGARLAAPARALTRLAAGLERRGLRGSTYTLVLRKEAA